MNILIIELVNIFFAGLLAGLEIAVHYGFHPQTKALDEKPQIILRQGVARTLRWIAPGFFLPMTLSGIILTIMAGVSAGFYFRLAAIVAIVVWIMIRIIGTVPINSATIEWNPDAPPKNWREQINKAERFHILGTWAAVIAFAFFVIAFGLQLTAITAQHAWTSFENPALGISLEYPADILTPAQDATATTTSVEFPYAGKTIGGNAEDGIRIGIEATDAKDIAGYFATPGIQTPVPPTSITVGGLPAMELDEMAYADYQLYLIRSGKLYTITINLPSAEAEHVKSSIVFTK